MYAFQNLSPVDGAETLVDRHTIYSEVMINATAQADRSAKALHRQVRARYRGSAMRPSPLLDK